MNVQAVLTPFCFDEGKKSDCDEFDDVESVVSMGWDSSDDREVSADNIQQNTDDADQQPNIGTSNNDTKEEVGGDNEDTVYDESDVEKSGCEEVKYDASQSEQNISFEEAMSLIAIHSSERKLWKH
ncbi:hypothetical protein JTB14_022918 [Gonioctena quinquepunctata]|nr:hypothetical protein JTB14_022918 [Gonioctena quinquepunctata]